MHITRDVEATGDRPSPARTVVQFRARRGLEPVMISSCDQNHRIGQQGCRVRDVVGVEAARSCPNPACWVVEFRARRSIAIQSSHDKRHPVR